MTFDFAVEKAHKIYDGFDMCIEYDDSYVFIEEKMILSFGGFGSPLVIMKSDGEVRLIEEYYSLHEDSFWDNPIKKHNI